MIYTPDLSYLYSQPTFDSFARLSGKPTERLDYNILSKGPIKWNSKITDVSDFVKATELKAQEEAYRTIGKPTVIIDGPLGEPVQMTFGSYKAMMNDPKVGPILQKVASERRARVVGKELEKLDAAEQSKNPELLGKLGKSKYLTSQSFDKVRKMLATETRKDLSGQNPQLFLKYIKPASKNIVIYDEIIVGKVEPGKSLTLSDKRYGSRPIKSITPNQLTQTSLNKMPRGETLTHEEYANKKHLAGQNQMVEIIKDQIEETKDITRKALNKKDKEEVKEKRILSEIRAEQNKIEELKVKLENVENEKMETANDLARNKAITREIENKIKEQIDEVNKYVFKKGLNLPEFYKEYIKKLAPDELLNEVRRYEKMAKDQGLELPNYITEYLKNLDTRSKADIDKELANKMYKDFHKQYNKRLSGKSSKGDGGKSLDIPLKYIKTVKDIAKLDPDVQTQEMAKLKEKFINDEDLSNYGYMVNERDKLAKKVTKNLSVIPSSGVYKEMIVGGVTGVELKLIDDENFKGRRYDSFKEAISQIVVNNLNNWVKDPKKYPIDELPNYLNKTVKPKLKDRNFSNKDQYKNLENYIDGIIKSLPE